MAAYKISKDDITSKLNFVGGKRVTPSSPVGKFANFEPSTGAVICEVPASGPSDVDAAIKAASDAFPAWAALSGLDRAKILQRAAEYIRANVEELAPIESRDNGKSVSEAEGDIQYAADTFTYYAGLAPSVAGEHTPLSDGSFFYTRREPLGVCAGIGAWNYPFQTCSWKLAPALACGNTVVYKPSPLAPLSPVILAEILTAAGVPPGVVNIVQGEAQTGESLVVHPKIAKVSFTGSVPTGQKIMQMCARSGVRPVTLELGGKSPLIIFDDANLDNAVKGAMLANFLTQGEVCSNASRIFVQKSIVGEFTKAVLERVKKLQVGDPLKRDTRVGAVISEAHMKRILDYVESAKSEGGKILIGGTRYTPNDDRVKNGFYVAPTVIGDAKDTMKAVREEIFGPVMAILPFDTEEEVLHRANDTTYGLAAGVFTRDVQRAHRVVAKLQAGCIWINNYNMNPVEMPFGGFKSSGFGRELGTPALHHYTQVKSVYVEMNDVQSDI